MGLKHLTHEQLCLLDDAWQAWTQGAQSLSQRCSRNRLLLVYLLVRFGALRLGEALAFDDRKDMNVATCTLRITGSRGREVQIPKKAMAAICALTADTAMEHLRGEITHLDQGYVRRRFYAAAQACGIPEECAGPQIIRHSRGLELLQGNLPLDIVQKFLGQRSPIQAASFMTFSDEDSRRIVHHHLRQEALRHTGARNALTGSVTEVTVSDVTGHVGVQTLEGWHVHVVITVESIHRLNIHEGMVLTVTVKASAVSLSPLGEGAKKISGLPNTFPCMVTGLQRGEVATLVIGTTKDGTRLCSVLLNEDADELSLRKDLPVCMSFSPFAAVLTLPTSG